MKLCSVAGCTRKHYANGYCRGHYDKARRNGTPHRPAVACDSCGEMFTAPSTAVKICKPCRGECSEVGCGNVPLPHGRWLCYKHYEAWRKEHRDSVRTPASTLREAFERVPATRLPSGCIEWGGSISGRPPGYGHLNHRGKRFKAHRVAYELSFGEILDGMVIDHLCHNTICVNVDHLRAVTQKQNSENLTPSRRNSQTGIRGVTYDAKRNAYRARIKHNYRDIHVGRFATLEEAAKAVADARRQIFTHSVMDT